MNAQQLIKYQIIKNGLELYSDFALDLLEAYPTTFGKDDGMDGILAKINHLNIDEIYDEFEYYDALIDARSEVRSSGQETNLKPTNWSQCYEVVTVALEIKGVWVAWDYFYGGSKFGQPAELPWIKNARIVSCKTEKVTVDKHMFLELESKK